MVLRTSDHYYTIPVLRCLRGLMQATKSRQANGPFSASRYDNSSKVSWSLV